MQSTNKQNQVIAALSSAGGVFALGLTLGWSAPARSRLLKDDNGYFPISESEYDWVASIFTIGCAVSCLPIGMLMRIFGRKWTMIAMVVPFVVGWSLIAWAQSLTMLLIGRLLVGLAGGSFAVSSPQYSAEIAENQNRGILGSFNGIQLIAGILFSYIIGAYMSVFWTCIVSGLVAIIFATVFFFMPESPAYLVFNQREEEARRILKWLRGRNYNPTSEIDELRLEMDENRKNKVSIIGTLKKTSTKRALCIGFGLMFFQQSSGISFVLFYTTFIFEAAKTGINADVQTIISGVVLLVACISGTMFVDKVGRKVLLMTSAVLITLTLVILGIYFRLVENGNKAANSLGWLPLTALCIYLIGYAVGFGPLPWLLISEVYSKDYNAIASPLNGAFSWMLAFAVTASFGSITEAIGIGQTFFIFTCLSLFGTFFIHFVVIETKAKSIAEIQRLLAS